MITDIKQATYSVCDAVEAAEQMANERVSRIIVNISGDRVKSSIKRSAINLNKSKPVSETDIKKVIEKGINKINVENNELIHCLPTGYRLDFGEETNDPRNLYGESLSVDVLLGLVPEIMYRNVKTVLDNSHLGNCRKSFVFLCFGPVLPGRRRKELGATVVDIGGGTTSIASFKHGHPVYFGSIAVGSNNITNDIAWGLTTSFTHAERLKTLHGCAFMTSKDKNETINVYPVGEEDDSLIKQVPKSELIGIITPASKKCLKWSIKNWPITDSKDINSHRIVLTGGGSLLSGMREVAAMILDKTGSAGSSRNIANMLDISNYPVLQSPAFFGRYRIAVVCHQLYRTQTQQNYQQTLRGEGSRFNRIMNWLKQNFDKFTKKYRRW